MERQQEEGLGHQGRLKRARSRRSGRAGAFSLGLLIALLLLGYAALRAFELAPREEPVSPAAGSGATLHDEAAAGAAADEPDSWQGVVALGEARVRVRFFPLHDEGALEGFRAQALRARYGLEEGEPWRLYLSLEAPAATPVVVRSARAVGADGAALVPFAEVARGAAPVDPIHALLAAAPAALEVEHARPMVLWGKRPRGPLRLELSGDGESGDGVSGEAVLEPTAESAAPRWYAGEELAEVRANSLEQEVARLTLELEREKARRSEREQAFQEFTRLFAETTGARAALPAAGELEAAGPVIAPTPEEEARRAAEEQARARAEELGRALAVLMRLEGLRGLDLLESGTLLSGARGAIGPVVFRCLDERGLLTGSVTADRLWLEASVAARTLTIVLDQGFESRGGERVPFENGARRIFLTDVDPERWLEECPELFDDADLAPANDDGRWNLSDVRRELNRLLALDPSRGWYRLHSLGGVRGPELRDVQLEELETSGRLRRRFFADRLRLVLEDGGLALELRDGAIVRGEEKQPFRDGRYRIVLPGASAAAWRAIPLPGLSEPPKAAEKPGDATVPSSGR